MDKNQNELKEFNENLEVIDLSNDIYNGNNLLYNRRTIPMYLFVTHIEINPNFIENEKNIAKYIENIKRKYGNFMAIVNFFNSKIQWNGLENCIDLLENILVSKISGKAIEESNRKES